MTFEDFADCLAHIRKPIVHPGNIFTWTGWQDAVEALADIDATRAALILERPEGRKRAVLLFATDGPLHRLALDSGWESKFWQICPQLGEAHEPMVAALAE